MTQLEKLPREVVQDLALNEPFIAGQQKRIHNCWHFSTDGASADCVFYDDEDFRDGMNRIYCVLLKCRISILAFTLMGNHVHFVLYGELDECQRFVNEYVKRTSMAIESRHGESKKLKRVPVDFQPIEDDLYLKSVICYVIRNATVAGLPYLPWDYPWSSGPLYFRRETIWTYPCWTRMESLESTMTVGKRRELFKTNEQLPEDLKVINNLIFPGEYVSYRLVELIFKTEKSYDFFLYRSKDRSIEQQLGLASRLTIPDHELRQIKSEVCIELYGKGGTHYLDVNQRLRIARELRRRVHCSKKQVARICGIAFDEIKDLV